MLRILASSLILTFQGCGDEEFVDNISELVDCIKANTVVIYRTDMEKTESALGADWNDVVRAAFHEFMTYSVSM